MVKNVGEILLLAIHDNGEIRVRRSGCTGAEYYYLDGGIARVKEFLDAGYDVYLVATFARCVDGEDGYYLPPRSVQKKYSSMFSDMGVKQFEIDSDSTVSFYGPRNAGTIGFTPSSERCAKDIERNERKLGVNTFPNKSLYKDYVKS